MNKNALLVCLTVTSLLLDVARAQDDADDMEPTNYCISADPALGDTAYWAISAVELFSKSQFEDAIAVVDACFDKWGPEGGHLQKALHEDRTKCPDTGEVSKKDKKKIDANGLINDVSLALWAKARSLHELDQIDAAKQTYARCIYMTCGRAWDPNGWYWSPAEDCAEHAEKLLD